MKYLKSLSFNFLAVFFANHILPGITVIDQTRLPHLGGDLPFAVALGFLNSLIYPVLKLVNRHTSALHLALAALILNFLVYALLKFLPLGIHLLTIEGYFLTSSIVALVSFLTNYWELKTARAHPPVHTHPHPMAPPPVHPPKDDFKV